MSIYNNKNPSQEYKNLVQNYKEIHKKGTLNFSPKDTYNGLSTINFVENLKKIINKNKCKSLLDYGSGKGDRYFNESLSADKKIKYPPLKDFWNIQPTLFDPGVPHPKPKNILFDIEISFDVLEHIPRQDLGWVVNEIFEFSGNIVFINVACYKASAILPNKKNAHTSVFNPWWWHGFISAVASNYDNKAYLVCTYFEKEDRTKPKYLSFLINEKSKND